MKQLTGIWGENETKPNPDELKIVWINGFKWWYDTDKRMLWDENLQSFTRLSFLTENERKQLNTQLKYN